VTASFGHVRGFDHSDSLQYFERRQRGADGWLPWHLLEDQPRFLTMGSRDGLQAADQYAGMLNVALHAGEFGRYEHQHLMAVRHQVRRSGRGQAWGYGFKVMAQPGVMDTYPWWADSASVQRKKLPRGPGAPQPNGAGRAWQQTW